MDNQLTPSAAHEIDQKFEELILAAEDAGQFQLSIRLNSLRQSFVEIAADAC